MSTKLQTSSFPAIYIKPSYADRLHERILRVHEIGQCSFICLSLTVHQRVRKNDVRWEEILLQ